MRLAPSPLERWFTERPGPFTHALAGTAAEPWGEGELAQLLGAAWPPAWPLGYPDLRGDEALRAALAQDFGLPGAEHLLLSAGANEANFLALVSLLAPGDRVLVAGPIYPQIPCLLEGLGAQVDLWQGHALGQAEAPWADFVAHIQPGHRMVILNAPHNPLGHDPDPATWQALVARCREVGAWLLVDEVYRGVGAGDVLPQALAWGPDGVLVSGSFSKALALPGLRVGWLAGDAALLKPALAWREHSSLSLAAPAMALAALAWAHRPKMLPVAQGAIARNRAELEAWVQARSGWWLATSPRTGVALLGRPGLDDEGSAAAWAAEGRGLVVPGRRVGYPGAWRVGLGARQSGALLAALDDLVAHSGGLSA